MARIAKHISIARTEGAEAGLRALVAYLNSPLGKANENVVDTRNALQACGNFEAAIPVYTELFLADDEQVIEDNEPSDWLSGTIAAPAKPKRPRKGGKTAGPITKLANEKPRTWNAYWVERNEIPQTVGATFTYTSKKYRTTSKHRVESVLKDGSVVTRRISLTRKGR
jgi:hypothetical protein